MRYTIRLSCRTRPLRQAWWISGTAAALCFFASGGLAAEQGDAEKGKAVVEKHNCRSCHTIGGQGGVVGPDLDQTTLRHSDEWLRLWLADPLTVKPRTLMPKFPLTKGERGAVITYLHGLAKPVAKDKLLALGGAKAGEALITAYECFACHKVAGQPGRAIYPDLTTLKQRRDPDWEKTWLKDPAAVKPGTFMPNFRLSAEEIEAIVAYLYR